MTEYCPGANLVLQDNGGGLNTALPARFVWHITWDALGPNGERPSFDAVAGYLLRVAYEPHIMWDPFTGRIDQYLPASQSARALVAWNEDGAHCIQVETLFSPGCVVDGVKYATVADTPCIGLDTLLEWADSLGVPRSWPMGAPQWSGNSRDAAVWNSHGGHYGHCNVPDNTHSDPGPMPDITGAISPQGTITQEQDMPLSGADHQFILEVIDDYFKNVRPFAGNRNIIDALNQTRSDIGNIAAIVPASVLEQKFKLADGTVTNLAGILGQIHTNIAAPAAPAPAAGAATGPGDPAAYADAVVTALSGAHIQISK